MPPKLKLPAKKTVQQSRQERQGKIAAAPRKVSRGPIEALVNQINARLGGMGHVYTADTIGDSDIERRPTGIPSLDYVLSGGYPCGGIIQIGGEYSVGKTWAALVGAKTVQRTTKGRVGWVSLEPFSKKRAREVGFFLPFSEDKVRDFVTGKMKPVDPFAAASDLEKWRMEEAGITDPYTPVSEFVLVQEQRGDVAFDAALDMLKSNLFDLVVVDSLGAARSSKWITENETQDFSDFAREPKMIGDYTTRCMLYLNQRYDETNKVAKDGKFRNRTTMLHLNQIVTAIGTMARAKHKTQTMKGGEGNKHNSHAIVFMWKGGGEGAQGKAKSSTGREYVYSQRIQMIGMKSKIGRPFLEGEFDLYLQDFGDFHEGDNDVVKDVVQLASMAGIIERNGGWHRYGDFYVNGKEAFADALRAHPDAVDKMRIDALGVLRR